MRITTFVSTPTQTTQTITDTNKTQTENNLIPFSSHLLFFCQNLVFMTVQFTNKNTDEQINTEITKT